MKICFRSLKYCDLRVISCSYLQRTTLEQELGLAAYLVKAESRLPHNPGPGSNEIESDAEKLSSTDNEEEEGHENGRVRLKMNWVIKTTNYFNNISFSGHFQETLPQHPLSHSSHALTVELLIRSQLQAPPLKMSIKGHWIPSNLHQNPRVEFCPNPHLSHSYTLRLHLPTKFKFKVIPRSSSIPSPRHRPRVKFNRCLKQILNLALRQSLSSSLSPRLKLAPNLHPLVPHPHRPPPLI